MTMSLRLFLRGAFVAAFLPCVVHAGASSTDDAPPAATCPGLVEREQFAVEPGTPSSETVRNEVLLDE